ncbi:MAG: acylphosphatase [Candidatus Cloacimonetes bacterium]|nr:acylphosphatase [Candidatus Cloacimonadota bacterium]MBL7108515.1 acylphosphatase [Candidatus Cloacimonadota bacterium]
MKKIKITIFGRVQGVFFRKFTFETALKFSIKGYVKNLFNGNVEVVAIGIEENVKKFVNALKIGPSSARVDNIEIEKLSNSTNYDSFKITY